MPTSEELYSNLKEFVDLHRIVNITDLVEHKMDYTSNQVTLAIGKLKNEGYKFFTEDQTNEYFDINDKKYSTTKRKVCYICIGSVAVNDCQDFSSIPIFA